MNTNILKTLAVVFATVLFVSCDKDYNTLGSDVLGGDNIDIEGHPYDIKVYNKEMGPVQSNNLPINKLGVLNNEAFGTTTANFVTQLELATVAPTFKSHVVVDSVVLSVPYFSTKLSTDSDGRGVYKLDSIYSNKISGGYDPINLKVYRNGYNLLDVSASDPSLAAKYYSNQDADINASKTDLLGSINSFVPKENEYKKYKRQAASPFGFIFTEVESRSIPRLRVLLDNDYFKTAIIDTDASNLVNNNAFKNHFKGLYFNVENIGGNGSLMTLDFTKGDVTVYYHQDKIKNDTALTPEQEMASLTLNMKGNTVNLLNNSNINTDYNNAVTNPTILNGHPQLFLKGGQGSQTFIELFNDTQLTELKALNPLINEAMITFKVNESYLNTKSILTNNKYTYHPKRIYLFDADNDRILFDYAFDGTTNSADFKLNKSIFGGILGKNDAGEMIYKFRITEHISRIIKDKTGTYKNVRLGLVVTENVNLPTYGSIGSSFLMPYINTSTTPKEIKTYPLGAILNPFGTVLFGNTNDAATEVTFKINYTKPN